MRTFPTRAAVLSAAAFMLVAGPALAHPKLLKATPAANATVKAPARIELHFSETLEPKFSTATLTMPEHGGMSVTVAAAVDPKDRKTLVVTPKGPLMAGAYAVNWAVTSTDTHKVNGVHSFKIG